MSCNLTGKRKGRGGSMSDDTREAIKFVTSILLGIVLFIFLITASFCRLSFPGDLAEIEQLRRDVQRVDAKNAEDVFGLAAKANQRIISNQAYNRLWWSDVFIPDGWDAIEVIEIPKGER